MVILWSTTHMAVISATLANWNESGSKFCQNFSYLRLTKQKSNVFSTTTKLFAPNIQFPIFLFPLKTSENCPVVQ